MEQATAQETSSVVERFSLKAFMPSVWSAVAKAEWNSLRSYSRPSDNDDSKARLTASLAIRDADSDI